MRTMKWGSLTVLSGLLAFCFDLAFAVALQHFLVSVGLLADGTGTLSRAPTATIWFEAALVMAAGVARVALIWVNSFATGVTSVTFESAQRRDIARWALHSGRASIGEVTTLFNDVVIGASAVVSNLFYVLSRIVLTGATFVALAIYSLPVTATIVVIVALALPLQRLIDRGLNQVSSTLQQSLAQAVSRLVQGVKNSVFLKIHDLSANEARRNTALIGSYERNTRRYYSLSSARGQVPQLIAMFVVIGIAILGSSAFGDEPAGVVAYLYLALRLFQGLSEMARVSANTRVNRKRYDVLRDWWRTQFRPQRGVIEAELTDHVPSAASPKSLGWTLTNVSFAWTDSAPILARFNAHIAPGSVTVIVGPSGVGKTTLLLILAGALAPTAGTVEVVLPEGTQPIASVRSRLAGAIAYVGPDPFVVPGTLREFLLFGLTEGRGDEEINEALRKAHCEFVFDLGLEHYLTEQGEGLSAGQKQRLSLARALLRRPKVLLLDEPTANLDPEAERMIVITLNDLKGDLTIVAVTHRDALRGVADQVVELAPAMTSPGRENAGVEA